MNGMSMNIGDAARASGVTAKMIRHYESIGLIPGVGRTESGYRTYTGNHMHTLRFIRQARTLGFSMKQIAELLSLWRDQRRPSRKVKALALAHVAELDERIAELEAMKQTLQRLAAHCHGDDRPECPILERLADSNDAAPRAARKDGARARTRALHGDPCH